MRAFLLPVLLGSAWFGWSLRTGVPPASVDTVLGADLYLTQCSSCHGPDGGGVEGRGPNIRQEGPAAVDFVLRTGRMPMADPGMQAQRGPVRYTDAQIRSLVDHLGSLGSGPGIPQVDPSRGSLADGGELFRLNCAACHVASAAGAAIGGGREAPSLMRASPTEIGEAILVGPGAMPVFGTFDGADIDDVAAYIAELQRSNDDTVSSLGGAGPVAEGLAAWLLCLLPIVALTRWIGTPHEGRDEHARSNPQVR